MRRARLGVVVGAAALVAAATCAWLSPGTSVAAGPLDQRVDRSIDVGGIACVDLAARVSLTAPMELAVQQASVQPGACRR